MEAKFVVFENVLINVEDVSWAEVVHAYTSGKDLLVWTLFVHFRGVNDFPRFDYDTEKEARAAHFTFTNLIGRAIGDLK